MTSSFLRETEITNIMQNIFLKLTEIDLSYETYHRECEFVFQGQYRSTLKI